MFNPTQLGDDELRTELFNQLVDRLEGQAQTDASIAVVNRMPTVFALSRRNSLFTVSEGLGLWLLRGDLKSKDRRQLRTFNVSRATIQSRLAIMPDHIEGTPDEILDQIVAMFLEWTAIEQEGKSAAPDQIATDAPAVLLANEGTPPLGSPTRALENQSVPRLADRSAGAATADHSGPGGPLTAMSAFRTYELLFVTARREFAQANAVPADSRYFLVSSGVFVALTAEAFFNDLGSRVMPSWPQLHRLEPREKAEVLMLELFNQRVDWNGRPFQSVAAALDFRRALAHAHAETLSMSQLRGAEGPEVRAPRPTVWQELCEPTTIYRWIVDVHLLIDQFSRAHDTSHVPGSKFI